MNKKELLALFNKVHEVEIPSMGRKVYIKELSYKGAIEVVTRNNPIDRSVFTLVYGLCDKNGKQIFTTDDVELIADTFSFLSIQEIASEVTKITKLESSQQVK